MSIYYFGSMAYDSEYLAHHGIFGMHWGVRRFQNPDGTLTEAGKQRYGSYREQRKFAKALSQRIMTIEESKELNNSPQIKDIASKLKKYAKRYADAEEEYYNAIDKFYKDRSLSEKYKKMAIDKVLNEWPESFGGASKKEILKNYDYLDVFQNEYDAFEIFRSNKSDKRNKEYNRIGQNMLEARKEMEKTAKEYAASYLGEYGKREYIPNVKGYTLSDSVAFRAISVASDNQKKKKT